VLFQEVRRAKLERAVDIAENLDRNIGRERQDLAQEPG